MATRFIGKNLVRKVVRPMKNSTKYANYGGRSIVINDEEVVVSDDVTVDVATIEEAPIKDIKKENKKQKKSKDMNDENKLAQIEAIAGTKAPNANVKVEKADKGLYEREESSTILLTEDNKMLLND